MLAIATPYPQFFGLDGKPLDGGSLYIGLENLDPEANPAPVYWDAAGAIPAAQPIPTLNGYPARSGTPAHLYCDINFSLRVRNSQSVEVLYAPSAQSFSAPTIGSVSSRTAGTATQGQTVLTVATYTPGVSALLVTRNGLLLRSAAFTQSSSTTITLATPMQAGEEWEVISTRLVTSGVDSAQVSVTSTSTPRSLDSKLGDWLSVLDKGADSTGALDCTTAFNAATGVGVLIPPGTYKTDGALTGAADVIAVGAAFTGSNPLDSWMPGGSFGTSVFEVYSRGGTRNAIVGAVRNTVGGAYFPTGVTGLGRLDAAGGVAFGIYAEARQYANTGVAVGGEIDSFNYGAAPTNTTTPDRGIGTAQQLPNAVTVAAGGTADSWCGIHVAREGSAPRQFRYGVIFSADAVTQSAIVIESTSTTGPDLPVLIKHKPAATALQVNGQGAPIAANAWLTYFDGAAAEKFAVKQNGEVFIAATKVLGSRDTGWTAMTGTTNKATAYDTSTVTLAQLAGRVMALQAALTAHGLIGA